MATKDNVVKMPGLLDKQAEIINEALIKATAGREDWIEAQLAMAGALATARRSISSHKAFGEWCSSKGFGENVISADTRAALIQFGSDLSRARTLLTVADGMSVRMVYLKEWSPTRYRNAAKTVASRSPKLAKAKVFAQAYEAEKGKLPPENEVAREAGVSASTAHFAVRELKNRQTPPEDAPIKYSKAQTTYVEAKLKVRAKQLESEFNERVRLAMLAKNKDYLAGLDALQAEARQKEALYRQVLNDHKPILTEEEYKTILICLHPDNSATKERRETAFKAFSAVKLQLTGKK